MFGDQRKEEEDAPDEMVEVQVWLVAALMENHAVLFLVEQEEKDAERR